MDDFDEFDDMSEDDGDVEEIDIISPAVLAKLRRLCEAREKRDQAKVQWQTDKDDCEEIELEVFDMFEARDADGNPRIKGTLKVNLGEPWGWVAFRTRETHYAKIIDEDEVAEHYEKRALMEEVSAPKFIMKRLNSDLNAALEQGQDPPPGIVTRTARGMTVTSQK